MPPSDADTSASPAQAGNAQPLIQLENAELLASLIKALPSNAGLQPNTIRQALHDPVTLSRLVRQLNLDVEVERNQAAEQSRLASILARVAPQRLDDLLATLGRQEQPAVNVDESYGAATLIPAQAGTSSASASPYVMVMATGQQSQTAETQPVHKEQCHHDWSHPLDDQPILPPQYSFFSAFKKNWPWIAAAAALAAVAIVLRSSA